MKSCKATRELQTIRFRGSRAYARIHWWRYACTDGILEQEHQISGSSYEERYTRTGYRAICCGEGWKYYQCKILRGVDPELDKEAVRVVSAMPKWKPGTQRGEAVRVRFTVPVMFRLTEDKIPVKYAPIENKINELVVVGYAPEGTTVPEEGTILKL